MHIALLSSPPATLADACQASGLDRTAARAALAGLAARGLVARQAGGPVRYAAVAPELALGRELARREAELGQARAVVAGLAER